MVHDREEADLWSAWLPARTDSVRTARNFTQDALRGLGASSVEEPVTLLVSELATNAILHAHSRVRLTVRRHDDAVRIEMRDDDPTPPRVAEPDPLSSGGRGIMLVDLLSSEWGVNRNEQGKTVWFEIASRS